MHKNRVGQKRKLSLQWNGKDWKETSKILKAFNPEEIQVRYPDLMSGKYETRKFYVGDRTAPVKWWWVGNQRTESISFDIIGCSMRNLSTEFKEEQNNGNHRYLSLWILP